MRSMLQSDAVKVHELMNKKMENHEVDNWRVTDNSRTVVGWKNGMEVFRESVRNVVKNS